MTNIKMNAVAFNGLVLYTIFADGKIAVGSGEPKHWHGITTAEYAVGYLILHHGAVMS